MVFRTGMVRRTGSCVFIKTTTQHNFNNSTFIFSLYLDYVNEFYIKKENNLTQISRFALVSYTLFDTGSIQECMLTSFAKE